MYGLALDSHSPLLHVNESRIIIICIMQPCLAADFHVYVEYFITDNPPYSQAMKHWLLNMQCQNFIG